MSKLSIYNSNHFFSSEKSVGRQLVWAELGTSASLPGVTHTSEVPCQVSQSLIRQWVVRLHTCWSLGSTNPERTRCDAQGLSNFCLYHKASDMAKPDSSSQENSPSCLELASRCEGSRRFGLYFEICYIS